MPDSSGLLGIVGGILGQPLGPKNPIGFNTYFRDMSEWYRFYFFAYKGWPHTNIHIPEYLFRHMRESERNYNKRIKRVWPVNFSKAIVDKTVAAVYTEAVSRDIEKESQYQMFLDDCDLHGCDFESFMKLALTMSYVNGPCAILLDRIPKESREEFLGVSPERLDFPYVTYYNANCICDWGFDKFHNINYILFTESPDELTYYRTQGNGRPVCYRLVTREKIYFIQQDVVKDGEVTKYEFKVTEHDHILSKFKMIPVVMVVSEKFSKNPFVAASGLSELALIDRSLIYYISLRDEILGSQTFSQLIMQAASDDDIKEVEVGTSVVLRYPPEMNPPSFITTPETAVSSISSAIESAVVQIQRITDQRFATAGTDSSAQSKEWDFHSQEFGIVGMAKLGQRSENKIFKMLSIANGDIEPHEESEIKIAYSDAFDIQGAREFINNFIAANVGVPLPPRAIKLGSMTVVKKLFKNLSPEDREEIQKQLDEMEKNDELVQPKFGGDINPMGVDEQLLGRDQNDNRGLDESEVSDPPNMG